MGEIAIAQSLTKHVFRNNSFLSIPTWQSLQISVLLPLYVLLVVLPQPLRGKSQREAQRKRREKLELLGEVVKHLGLAAVGNKLRLGNIYLYTFRC